MGLMASFERGMERFLVPVAIKLNSQKHVAAVRDGFVFTFPIIMASSLIILINFAILSPDGFIAGLLHLNSIFPNLEKSTSYFYSGNEWFCKYHVNYDCFPGRQEYGD